jgi:hypothetical protein
MVRRLRPFGSGGGEYKSSSSQIIQIFGKLDQRNQLITPTLNVDTYLEFGLFFESS